MRLAALAAVVAVALVVSSPVVAAPKHPADHHGYAWGAKRLVCTSVRKERQKADRTVVRVAGRTYWCHAVKPKPVVVPAGSASTAFDSLRAAMSARFTPGGPTWQAFTSSTCTGANGVYHCVFGGIVSGQATVTWSSPTAQAVVTFTSLVCSGGYAGRPECSL